MRHPIKMILMAVVCTTFLLAGCSSNNSQTTEPIQDELLVQQDATIHLPPIMTEDGLFPTPPEFPNNGKFPMIPENITPMDPAVFSSNINTGAYIQSTTPLRDKYSDPADEVKNYDFYAITIKLNGKTFTTDNSYQGVTITQDANGNLVITNTTNKLYNYVLSGTLDGSVLVSSDKAPYMLTLSGATITGKNLPALQLKSTTKAFITIADRTTNVLSDSASNTKKGVITNDGDLIFTGSGDLSVTAYKKHAVKAGGTVRISSGNITLITDEKAEGNGIHADEAFVMDDGNLTIKANGSVYGEESKGIKVNGLEIDLVTKFDPKGYLVVNGGVLNITSVGKAMTAGWKVDEDAKTKDTSDDPKPDLIINGGVIVIQTTGTPYEVSDDESLSPEGLEAKDSLIINGGYIEVTATDDALNAGNNITINGGLLFAHSSQADALDSNGTIIFNGGTTVALGGNVPEMGIDCDMDSAFTYHGGTLVAMGGAGNNTPLATDTTGYVITYGNSVAASSTLALLDSSNKVVVGFTVPDYYTAGSATLIASDTLTKGSTYSIVTGGTITSEYFFNGIAIGSILNIGGTNQGSVAVASTVSNIGAAIRTMGGGRPGDFTPPEGFDPSQFDKDRTKRQGK